MRNAGLTILDNGMGYTTGVVIYKKNNPPKVVTEGKVNGFVFKASEQTPATEAEAEFCR